MLLARLDPRRCEIPHSRVGAEPDFAFGHRISQVIDAVLKSAAERRWVRIDEI